MSSVLTILGMSAKYLAVSKMIRQTIGDPPPRGAMTKLARAVGVDKTTAGRWWALTQSPDPAQWEAIEDHLGLDRGQLALAHAAEGDEITRLRRDIDRLEHLGIVVTELLLAVDGRTRRSAHPERRAELLALFPDLRN